MALAPESLTATPEVHADERPFPAIVGWHPWFPRTLRGPAGVAGGEVEIAEPGATAWSHDTGGSFPAGTSEDLFIRVRVKDPKAVSAAGLNALVVSAKPAHVPHRIEIVQA